MHNDLYDLFELMSRQGAEEQISSRCLPEWTLYHQAILVLQWPQVINQSKEVLVNQVIHAYTLTLTVTLTLTLPLTLLFYLRSIIVCRVQSPTYTHNWVLNTMVRSSNATLAARPNPSPSTMAKMKVMIQINCEQRARHTLQLVLMKSQCLGSTIMRTCEQEIVSCFLGPGDKCAGKNTCERSFLLAQVLRLRNPQTEEY